MKTLMLRTTSILLGMILSLTALAQNDCSSPDTIDVLPYSASGLTTTGTVDDYGPGDACGSDAMENEDYVFGFTPASDMSINISLTNTEIISDAPMSMGAAIGLFVVDGDPSDPATNCVASNDTATDDPYLELVELTADTTYYIIISSEDEDLTIDTYPTNVNFDISVSEVVPEDAGVLSIAEISDECGLSSENISCTIKNFGTNDISGFDVAYTVDGGAETVETFTGTLAYGEETTFNFSAPADLSGEGEHVIQAYSLLAGDTNNTNDTAQITVLNIPVISTLPYEEGFETTEHYWAGTGSWERGIPEDTNTINEPYEGDYVAGTNPGGNAEASESSTFTSPCFDFSGTGGISLSFAVWHEPGMLGADMGIETSIDGGTTWTALDSWTGSSGEWIEKNYDIVDFAGEADCKIRFYFDGGYLAVEGMAVDSIHIDEMPANDAGVVSISEIPSNCGMSDETVSCMIRNFGTDTISDFDVAYTIDGGSETVETFTDTLGYGEETEFSFSAQADLTGSGEHTIQAYPLLAGDENTANDTAEMSVLNLPVISTLPYVEGFENPDHFWTGTGSWARGIPVDTNTINTAYEGDYVAGTNPEGYAEASESSTFASPCFDFSGTGGISLSFAVWHEPSMLGDNMGIEISVDGGTTWTVLDDSWSGSSGEWVIKNYNVLDFAGEANCRIRFFFEGNYLAAEGLAVDNIHIEELPANDVAPMGLISPSSSCGLSDSESVKVLLTNHGVDNQTGFDISYSLDNGATWETETFTDIISYDEEMIFAFTTPVDMQNIDTYEVKVATGLVADENTANDTLEQTVVHSETITTFPYNEGFESGSAGWVADGENSSMELGEPAGTIIDTASDGDYAWVTNLDGPHNSSELAHLVSPCFDFSDMVNPVIDADIIYETQAMSAGFILEYSTDYGETWDTIPAGGAAENWYGDMLSATWNGSSGGWITAHNDMPTLAGEPTVMLRFAFDSGDFAMGDYEGVGIDNISITDCDVLPVADFEWTDVGGGTVQFTSLSENADSVEWNFGDNDLMPTTSNEENPEFTYPAQGEYTVTLTVFNECGSDEIVQTIEVIISGIRSTDNSIDVYPNPAGGKLFVEATGLKDVKLYALDGTCLLHNACNSNKIKLNTEDIAAGMYILKVNAEQGVTNHQIIIR
ncbi:MAG: T9SS type A sorting domain-containing protein [Bacteroidales bacterium]